jgi:hypothetical protein
LRRTSADHDNATADQSGEIPFNKRIAEFTPNADLLAPAEFGMLYVRGAGRLRSALELPVTVADETSRG